MERKKNSSWSWEIQVVLSRTRRSACKQRCYREDEGAPNLRANVTRNPSRDVIGMREAGKVSAFTRTESRDLEPPEHLVVPAHGQDWHGGADKESACSLEAVECILGV